MNDPAAAAPAGTGPASGDRIATLTAKLERGLAKTLEILGRLPPQAWQTEVYPGPGGWTLRDLLAHFVSAEAELLLLAQNVAAGGAGAPEGFDFNAFNATEKERLSGRSAPLLLTDLAQARLTTLDWVKGLPDAALDQVGRHPALGEISLESMILAIYGHQLLHMRDVQHGRG